MAQPTDIFVDPALAGDTGRGTRATITLSAATFNFGALTLNETNAFTAYNTLGFAAGDQIYLTGGTAVTVGLHAIASITSNSEIVMVADITSDSSSPTDVTSDTAPFGDLEYAIEQTTFDTTNGTRVHIKVGTDEVVVASLDNALDDTVTTVAWVPSLAAPCVFQGYTAVADDGGIGGISGGGSVGIFAGATFDFINFIDIHAHNCGSAAVFDVDNDCIFLNVEVNNTTGDGINTDNNALIQGCYVHDIGNNGLAVNAIGVVQNNFLANGTKDFVNAMFITTSCVVLRNIIKIDGTSNGISWGNQTSIINNSIWSNGGTGSGIRGRSANVRALSITNNLVEGFSGTGGVGFDNTDNVNIKIVSYGGNAAFDNATEYTTPGGHVFLELGGASSNETLSATPFTDASNDDFAPVNTGAVKEGSLPDDFGNGAI